MPLGFSSECPNCSWHPGWIPVAQHQGGDTGRATTFQAEPRHKFHAFAMMVTTALGGVAFFGSFSFFGQNAPDEGIALLIGGALLMLAGIYAMIVTGFGRVEWGLTTGQRVRAWPGIYIGAIYAVLLVLTWFILRAVMGSFGLKI
jgi:hypothetical protein